MHSALAQIRLFEPHAGERSGLVSGGLLATGCAQMLPLLLAACPLARCRCAVRQLGHVATAVQTAQQFSVILIL